MELLATGLEFPEGPFILPDGSIGLVEIAGQRLTRVGLDGSVSQIARIDGAPNGAAIGPDGRVYICNAGGTHFFKEHGVLRGGHQSEDHTGGRIEVFDLNTGRLETLYDQVDGRRLSGPNDLVFDADDGFWFTDLGKHRQWDRDLGAVYWARADGSEIRTVIQPILSPNGIGLSPDGKTLYVAETETARLWQWDIIGPGEVRKAKWPSPHGGFFVGGVGSHYCKFDSLAVTASGKVCVATLLMGGITEFDPQTGTSRHHPTMDLMASNICFGGPNMTTAYITLAGTGSIIALEWREPGLRLNHQPQVQSTLR